jgi:hypothetical protein
VDIGRAFSYIFEDQDWLSKLIIVVILAFFSAIPLLGLVAVAALLGYLLDLIRNMRANHPNPLPQWDNIGERITEGFTVLIAAIVYAIPSLAVSACAFLTNNFLHNSFLPLAITCCTLPFLIAYGILVLPMLAVGVARYLDSGESAEFYRFGELFGVVRENMNVTVQWFILAFIVNLILGLVAIIPCCGWIAVMGLAYPVQGHLLGQYVLELGGKAKRKRDGFYY